MNQTNRKKNCLLHVGMPLIQKKNKKKLFKKTFFFSNFFFTLYFWEKLRFYYDHPAPPTVLMACLSFDTSRDKLKLVWSQRVASFYFLRGSRHSAPSCPLYWGSYWSTRCWRTWFVVFTSHFPQDPFFYYIILRCSFDIWYDSRPIRVKRKWIEDIPLSRISHSKCSRHVFIY